MSFWWLILMFGTDWDMFEFDTVGLLGSIFHCHIYEDFVSKWADLSVCKAFIRDLLIKALQMLKSAHFDTKASQIWQWKIDPSNPTVSKMVQTCPNRSQTSKLFIRNTFWTSISNIRTTLKKYSHRSPLKKFLFSQHRGQRMRVTFLKYSWRKNLKKYISEKVWWLWNKCKYIFSA